MTAHGVLLVAGQEFRVRLRTGRWRWLLGVWLVVLFMFTALLTAALADLDTSERGIPLFGGLMLFVLMLVLLTAPAFTAQSINGDRERGTLATLQVTRLTPLEITLGKLLAGWLVGLGALGSTLPFVGWSFTQGGVSPLQAVVVLAVVAVLMGVVCAVSQALSALSVRSITSAALSYITVFALTIGTAIAFTLLAPMVDDEVEPWWLLAINPFVVLADAAPQVSVRDPETGRVVQHEDDILGSIGRAVREIRDPDRDSDSYLPPVWPYGLGFNLLLGAGSVWLTAQRLKTPARTLAPGTRIA